MTLNDYLEQTRKPVAEFAKAIGASRQAVYVFLGKGKSKKGKPSLKVALDIERVTGGLVPAESWVKR